MIKISNKLMDRIVNNKFNSSIILKDHKSDNTILPIDKDTIDKYFNDIEKFDHDSIQPFPHIELISDNSKNVLEIFLERHTEFIVTIDDISLKTNYVMKTDDKYLFS